MAPACAACVRDKKTHVLKLRWFVQALEGQETRKLTAKPAIGDTAVDYHALTKSRGEKLLPGSTSGRMVKPTPMIQQAFGEQISFQNRLLGVRDTSDLGVSEAASSPADTIPPLDGTCVCTLHAALSMRNRDHCCCIMLCIDSEQP